MLKKLIHKQAPLFLLLVAAFPLAYVVFLNISQVMARHKMKEKLEKELMVSITIPDDEVIWIKNGKEISINNRLFDIKVSKYKNGYYIFLGLYDDEETQLVKKMNSENGTGGLTDHIVLSKLIQLLFNSYDHPSEFYYSFFQNRERHFDCNKNNFAYPTLPVIAPPPKI